MSDFIEQNRRFFKTLSGLLRMVSSILLVVGLIWTALQSVGLFFRIGNWPAFSEYWHQMPAGTFLFILMGLIGRAISQLLRCLHDADYHPGWLLRRGDWLVYAYAVGFTAWNCIGAYPYLTSQEARAHKGYAVLSGVLCVLYVAAGDLILVGLGQFIKRLMPVIDEVRTLA